MSQTVDMPNYTIELSDGLIRPMTVKELAAIPRGTASMFPAFSWRRSLRAAIRWTKWSVSLPKRIAPIMVFPNVF